MKIDPIYVQRLAAELNAANPSRVPLECEDVLLERFIRALFFKSSTIRNITHGKANMWHDYAWVHQARRDRRNQKAIKEALARGETRLDGKPIGSPSEPCLYLCSRAEAWDLLREVTNLAYNLFELGELIGIGNNPYPDDESSMPPW